jgi:hypothetical protein
MDKFSATPKLIYAHSGQPIIGHRQAQALRRTRVPESRMRPDSGPGHKRRKVQPYRFMGCPGWARLAQSSWDEDPGHAGCLGRVNA